MPRKALRTRYPGAVNFSEAELLELIDDGEGRGLEFKRGLPRDERLARTLCAFANTRGGLLLVGVNDDGSLEGAPRPRQTMADIRRVGRDFLDPPIELTTQTTRCEERTIVVAQIPVSPSRPHKVLHETAEDEIVVRVGSSNRVARGATLSALRAGRSGSRSRSPLEKQILAWVAERTRVCPTPGGDATPAGFAASCNLGAQRARRAFVQLERDGLLVGHGRGAKRIYSTP